MRFLKNSFAAVLIICTLASCSIAFAATPSSENSLGMSPQAQENFSKAPYKVQEEILSSPELSAAAPYAYMDLYSAPESLVSLGPQIPMTTLSIQMVQSNMILSSLICSQGGISPRLRIPSLKPPLSPSPSHWH